MSKKQLLVEVISQSQRTDTTTMEIINEGINTFSKKQEHFTGQLRKYNPQTEDDIQLDSEDSLVVTNVADKLKYIFEKVVEAVDLNLTKEYSNVSAFADIVVDGNMWAANVPVNAILTAETRIKRLRNLLLAIPTLEPKEKWTFSKEHYPALYSSETKTRMKTKKVEKYITVAQATDKHPEQVQSVSNDVVAGIWETTLLSGKINPSTKSKILARLDRLSGIFQNAREYANMSEVKELKLGKKISDYLMEPLTQDLK